MGVEVESHQSMGRRSLSVWRSGRFRRHLFAACGRPPRRRPHLAPTFIFTLTSYLRSSAFRSPGVPFCAVQLTHCSIYTS
jgi:hypothetical protein